MTNKTVNNKKKEIQINSKIKIDADSNLVKSNEIIGDSLTDLINLAKKYQSPQTVHDYFSSLQAYRLIIESSIVLWNHLSANSLLNAEELTKSKEINERLVNSLQHLSQVRDELNKITKDLIDVKVVQSE
jgi:hypothetical protein